MESAGPIKSSLLSVILGRITSMQIGFESITLKKLHSFLVAADAACSRGDLPVAAVEARLTAVPGLATAAVPTALAAAVLELLKAAKGAAHPLIKKTDTPRADKTIGFDVSKPALLCPASNVKYSGWPRSILNGFK